MSDFIWSVLEIDIKTKEEDKVLELIKENEILSAYELIYVWSTCRCYKKLIQK